MRKASYNKPYNFSAGTQPAETIDINPVIFNAVVRNIDMGILVLEGVTAR